MYWKDMPQSMQKAFCCPVCQGDLLERSLCLICADCGKEWPFIDRNVPCFASTVYESPQAKTERVGSKGKIRQSLLYQKARDNLSGIRAFLKRLILRDERFWEAQLDKFREIEEEVVEKLLDSYLCLPVELTIELGVGQRDKTKLYNRMSKYTICSDIFYDENVATRNKKSSNLLYGVINASQLPFREGSVDLLLTSHVVEHFPDKHQALNNIRRILKPGGWACHIVPIMQGHVYRHILSLITNPLVLTPCFLGGIHGEYDSIWEELKLNTVNSWRNLFISNNFHIVIDVPGKVFAMRPLSATMSIKLSNIFHLYGSHVFLTQKTDV